MAKETVAKTIIVAVLAVFIVLGWGIAFGYIKSDVSHIEKQSDENKADIRIVDAKANTLTNAITRIDTRQELMIKGIDEINEKLK